MTSFSTSVRYWIAALILLTAHRAIAQNPDDRNWDDEFGASGSNVGMGSELYALAVGNGVMYAGGSFLTANGKQLSRIAEWDGASWRPLGNPGAEGVDGPVFSIVVKGDSVIVGGQFSTAGGVPVKNIAVWKRSTNRWFPLGEGVFGGANAYVSSIVNRGDTIFAGGQFTTAGTATANNVAVAINGEWKSLGTANQNGVGGTVNSLAILDNRLYVGGNFTRAGNRAVNSLAQWTGVWNDVGGGVAGYVNTLAVSPFNTLMVGGKFNTAGTDTVMNLAMWNGSNWANNSLSESDLQDHPDSNLTGNRSLYEGLIDGEVRSIMFVGTDMYVGGNIARAFPGGATFQYTPISHIARYEHFKVGYSYFYNLRQGVDGYVNAMATDGKNLYAGGQFINAGGLTANYVARWDGRAWFTLGVEIGNTITGLAVKDKKVYAAWSTTPIGSSEPTGHIVQWDNPGWSGVAAPVAGQIYSVHRTGNDLIVGGAFVNAGDQVAVNVARLNLLDGTWHPLTRGSGVAGGDFSYVQTIAEHAGALYLGGEFTVADTIAARNIAMWEPSSGRWSAFGQGLDGAIRAIAVAPNGDVYAGGEFLTSGLDTVRRIARWDGQRWNPMLGGVDATVRAIAINGDNIYVAGDFDTVDGRPMNHIARWDTRTNDWHPLGRGIEGHFAPQITAMAVVGRHLFVAGFFPLAGGDSVRNIARWDGSEWNTLGSGLNNNAYALAVEDNRLYVGGAFTEAGAKPAIYIGLWREQALGVQQPSAVAGVLRLRVAPTITPDQTTITLQLPRADNLRVAVIDPLGRIVQQLPPQQLPAGTHSAVIDLQQLPQGQYYLLCQTSQQADRAIVQVVR
ncbi:MAG: hypothetical protein IT211_01545 [Armatimonadetes bacterium]|nr:hypothetical protein [Armatimonadota bacterium]